jgi:EAL domain-containing protein (putative c-di-GMP-specific phosphodiesterase class I)
MARALSLATMAEGVETSEQLMGYVRWEATSLRGTSFAKPQPPDDLLSALDPTASRTEAHAPQI